MSIHPETENSFNPDRQEGRPASPTGPENSLNDSIVEAYEGGDHKGGRALEQAQRFLQDNPDAPNKYGFAQRAMESVLESGEWSDAIRQEAVAMNTTQRVADGRPPMTKEAAFREMWAYARTWQKATLDGAKDGWLNQEGVSLGYWVKNAERGSVEGVDYMLGAVESLLAHSGNLTEWERGAQELRDLRDALFTEKQRLQAEADKQLERTAAQERQDAEVTGARKDVARVLEGDPPEEEPGGTVEQQLARRQAEFDASSSEEQAFLKAMVMARGDFRVAGLGDIGLDRKTVAALSGSQKERLKQLFTDVHQERLGINGEAAVAELEGRLRAGIAQIVEAGIVQEEPDTVAEQAGTNELERVESSVETAEPEPNREAITTPVVEKLQPRKSVPTQESAERGGNTEQQTADMLRMGINFANAYLKNPMTARWLTEQGVDLGELAERMEAGDFQVSGETARRMQRLANEARPQSDIWNTAPGASSMLGRAAAEAREELLGILRSM